MLALTSRSTSAGPVAGASVEKETDLFWRAPAGKSHSCVTPTRSSSRSSEYTISVAEGRSDRIRTHRWCPTGPRRARRPPTGLLRHVDPRLYSSPYLDRNLVPARLPRLEPRRRRPPFCRRHDRKTGATVYCFAHDVRVPRVACRLLDQMQDHPPQRPCVDIFREPGHASRDRYRISHVADRLDCGV